MSGATTPDPGGSAPPGYDAERVARAVRELLAGLGEDPDREGLRDTPRRVARAWADVLSGVGREPADVLVSTFEEGHDEVVLLRDLPVASMCEHHLLPWSGTASVGYLPSREGRLAGLSSLARLVDLCARRPTLQERVTREVADAVDERLQPRGVLVVVEAEHLCLTRDGTRIPGATTVTSAVRGVFRDRPATRAEALELLRRPR